MNTETLAMFKNAVMQKNISLVKRIIADNQEYFDSHATLVTAKLGPLGWELWDVKVFNAYSADSECNINSILEFYKRIEENNQEIRLHLIGTA